MSDTMFLALWFLFWFLMGQVLIWLAYGIYLYLTGSL